MKQIVRPAVLFTLVMVLGAMVFLPPVSGETTDPSSHVGNEAPDSRIVAYYFHGNFRCATCRKLEAYSEEAITDNFAAELESGRLEWKLLNTDEKENKHFVTDFELVTKSVVLVEYEDGKVVRFKNLKKVWELVGDKDRFLRYVRDATRDFIGQS